MVWRNDSAVKKAGCSSKDLCLIPNTHMSFTKCMPCAFRDYRKGSDKFSRTGVVDSCELLFRCWERNPRLARVSSVLNCWTNISSSLLIFLLCCAVLCVCVCAPLCLSEGQRREVHMCTCVCVGGCTFMSWMSSISASFPWGSLSHWIWSKLFQLDWLVKFQMPVSTLQCWGFRPIWLCIAYIWVLGIQTQVPMLVQQVFLSTDPSPQPCFAVFI